VLVVVRLHDLHLGTAAGLATAADVRLDVLLATLELVELHEQRLALGAEGRVGQVRLVRGGRGERDGVHAADPR
jgi:hypothetical protein